MEGYRKQFRRRETLFKWRFLTFSCYQRLPLLGNPAIRDLFAESLEQAHQRCGFRLRAWVVMPEHVHMMLAPTETDWPVAAILAAIKQPVAQKVLRRWRAIGAPVLERLLDSRGAAHFWQEGGGFDRNVRDVEELGKEIGYIHFNPVKRGLAAEPAEWVWSSARWYAGDEHGVVKVDLNRSNDTGSRATDLS